jgi:hypothetical protein
VVSRNVVRKRGLINRKPGDASERAHPNAICSSTPRKATGTCSTEMILRDAKVPIGTLSTGFFYGTIRGPVASLNGIAVSSTL